MNVFQPLIDIGQSFGLYGLLATALILILVYLAKLSGLVATGNHARIANIILSAIMFGLSPNPEAEKALQAALASIVAALLHELFSYLADKRAKG